MKTVLQNYGSGELAVSETPPPQLRDGWVLVKTAYSLISAGTEKTKIDTGSKSLLGKARSRPDLVRQVIQKARNEGVWKTWQTVSDRLNAPTPLGYSSAGQIVEVQGDVGGLRPGHLVSCGGGTASHSEIVSVPRNLAIAIPEGVSLDH